MVRAPQAPKKRLEGMVGKSIRYDREGEGMGAGFRKGPVREQLDEGEPTETGKGIGNGVVMSGDPDRSEREISMCSEKSKFPKQSLSWGVVNGTGLEACGDGLIVNAEDNLQALPQMPPQSRRLQHRKHLLPMYRKMTTV
jgi:hypothetical protein